jgi:hypothetical protein
MVLLLTYLWFTGMHGELPRRLKEQQQNREWRECKPACSDCVCGLSLTSVSYILFEPFVSETASVESIMEGPEAPSAIPGFSSLSLSRPDSYSAAGRVADASIPVLKQPQPMLYSPASGLGELCCLLCSMTAVQF